MLCFVDTVQINRIYKTHLCLSRRQAEPERRCYWASGCVFLQVCQGGGWDGIQGRTKSDANLNSHIISHIQIIYFINTLYFTFICFSYAIIFLFSPQFLTKNPARRLGCMAEEGGENAVTSHAFFIGIDWDKLNRRELEPPFKPRIVRRAHTHLIYMIDVITNCLQ